VNPGLSHATLPQFERGLLNSAAGVFSHSAATQSCGLVNFEAPCIAQKTYTSIAWNFGDPSSGTQNSSSAHVTTHTYTTNGQYKVKLILKAPTHTDTLWQLIDVNHAAPTISLSGK